MAWSRWVARCQASPCGARGGFRGEARPRRRSQPVTTGEGLEVRLLMYASAPVLVAVDLQATSNTGSLQDLETSQSAVTLIGITDPRTQVSIAGTGISDRANARGEFTLRQVELAPGDNVLTVVLTSRTGCTTEQTLTIRRVDADTETNVVLDWVDAMLGAIARTSTAPPVASRIMAMESLAIYDVVAAYTQEKGFYGREKFPAGADLEAAISQAAFEVLSALLPAEEVAFQAVLDASLATIPDGAGKTAGIAFGESMAMKVLNERANDGSSATDEYVIETGPGNWVPTAPGFLAPLLPRWAKLTPFTLSSPTEFLPPGSPKLTSRRYAREVQEVQAYGQASSTLRTDDQTEIARYWADGAGTVTPPGHWNEIAQEISRSLGQTVLDSARLLAKLNVALADAAITAWAAKYADNLWRPITAIQQADTDGNSATTADPTWQPLLTTPPFPEYVSGHSTFSAAAAGVLTGAVGRKYAFSSTSTNLKNDQNEFITRSFASFNAAAEEAGQSRIYGGIHFQSGNQDGLAAGKQVARRVLRKLS